MPTASQSAAGFSFLCLAAAGAWLVISEFPIASPGRPTTSAEALRVLEATVPSIGDFSSFDVNQENPFIPFQLREIEKTTKLAPPRPAGNTPRNKPPVIDEPAKPALPRLPSPGLTGPAATGILISKDGAQALLTFPGEKSARVMKAGDSVNGWTLVSVDGGNVAQVKQDATGATLSLIIPETLAPVKKPDAKPADGGKSGKDGKDVKVQPVEGAKGPKATAAPTPGGKAPAPGTDTAPEHAQPPALEPKLPPRPDKLM